MNADAWVVQRELQGFRWPVSDERIIATSVDRVWEVISSPGNLEQCHPFCASNPVHRWPGDDAHDEIHYLSGWVFHRRFVRWIDGVGYDLEIGRDGGTTSFVTWRIDAVDDGHTRLAIAVYPAALQTTPVVIRWVLFHLRIRPMLHSYLRSVTGGFDWFLTRGEPVPRNLFGSHPWFS